MKPLKNNLLYVMSIAILLLPLPASAQGPPSTMTYQGRLTDQNGAAVNEVIEVRFAIFDAEKNGGEVWNEKHFVGVDEGSFSIQLGSRTPLQEIFDGQNYWLELEIDGDILEPRSLIDSTPYSFYASRALTADNAAAFNDKSFQEVLDEARNAALKTPFEEFKNTAGESLELVTVIQELMARLDDVEGTLALLADQQNTGPVDLVERLESLEAALSGEGQPEGEGLLAKVETISNTLWGEAYEGGRKQDDGCDGPASDCADIELLCDINGTGLVAGVQALECLTGSMTRGTIDDKDSIVFRGTNVHIRNSQGPIEEWDSTLQHQLPESDQWKNNGLGNLIIGYDEFAPNRSLPKEGSHNLIVGPGHSYSSVGAIIAGVANQSTKPATTVIGGTYNHADALYSSITGGFLNTTHGRYSSITGGADNQVWGSHSSISGGTDNKIYGSYSSISGGSEGTIGAEGSEFADGLGAYSSISGGLYNKAYGRYSSISGGQNNTTGDLSSPDVSEYSTISGGADNSTDGDNATVSGGMGNQANGNYSSVSGGEGNSATGNHSSVSGGFSNSADGDHSSVSGGEENTAYGYRSSVSGGSENMAYGGFSSIVGGQSNTTGNQGSPKFSAYSTISGGANNTTDGESASVSGGTNNQAKGDNSSVSGGEGVIIHDDGGWGPGIVDGD